MNIIGKILLGAIVALSTGPSAFAQNQALDGPPLHAAPEFSQWTITLSYPDQRASKTATSAPAIPPASDSRPKEIVTTKTKNIVHEETTEGRGAKSEKWYVGATQYRKDPGATVWFANEPNTLVNVQKDIYYTPLPPSGFRGLEWLTPETYAGAISYQGRKCLVFLPGGAGAINLSSPGSPDAALAALANVAFIDADTRLPVEVRSGGIIQYYQFASQAPAMQSLPPDLAEQIKKGEEGRKKLDTRPPRPY